MTARETLRALVDGNPVPYVTFVEAMKEFPGTITVPIQVAEGHARIVDNYPDQSWREILERWIDPMNERLYGDIRDVLLDLPHGDIHGHGSYAFATDIFTVRWDLIHEFGPRCGSVFEFGALFGYFLVTALDACRYIGSVGWCDNEQHTQFSNQTVVHNLADYISGLAGGSNGDMQHDMALEAWPRFYRHRDQVIADIERLGIQYDLISVDAGHSYDECLWDLCAAHRLKPKWIMVDDWIAATHTAEIQSATMKFLEMTDAYDLSEHVTANGLAVLTSRT